MVYDLILKNRSYRRFRQARKIKTEELRFLIESARVTGSAANLQRIRYLLVNEENQCLEVFKTLSFAGYLKDWGGPKDGERPSAYIVLMTEKEPDTNLAIDIGLAAQSILLTAREMGLGGCMFRSFKSEKLIPVLNKSPYIPSLVIALGEPSEDVYIVDSENGEIKYYRDENDRHAVPKLSLDELIL